MKHKYALSALAVGLAIAIPLVALASKTTAVYYQVEVEKEKIVYLPEPKLSPAQILWLAKLMKCESGVNEHAVNPKDLDNTPSYGLLQFKPSTYRMFAEKYGIGGEYTDPEGQIAIVTHWILNPKEVRWQQQFPACVAKLGTPPTE